MSMGLKKPLHFGTSLVIAFSVFKINTLQGFQHRFGTQCRSGAKCSPFACPNALGPPFEHVLCVALA